MKRTRLTVLLSAIPLAVLLTACGEEQQASRSDPTPSEKETGVSVHFVSPEDGAMVTSPFEVEMAAEGVEVVPAGTMKEGTGHMHILVDTPFVLPGNVIPSDDQHLHYGDGSTTATLDLPAGEHVLRLQFADGAHKAFEGGHYRDVIVVNVEGRQDYSVSGKSPAPDAADEDQPAQEAGGKEDGADDSEGGGR